MRLSYGLLCGIPWCLNVSNAVFIIKHESVIYQWEQSPWLDWSIFVRRYMSRQIAEDSTTFHCPSLICEMGISKHHFANLLFFVKVSNLFFYGDHKKHITVWCTIYTLVLYILNIWHTIGWILGVLSWKPQSICCLIPSEKAPLFNRISFTKFTTTHYLN